MLYTNLETLIFPIATGFVATFESHFVYKGTYFVYKKYFLKMQALPAFVCDLDPFWIQVFILHLFPPRHLERFPRFFRAIYGTFCGRFTSAVKYGKIKAGKLVPGSEFISLF